ncbi:cupin domain-containing protein [Chelatococcus reniformis]|uniref:Cupin type-2 domain-containing protein n=1 Tax=Chelatococcus reniformis TaxID=1494448 RepID=A0A916U8D5_9HYPH|nr:cupin domain-containing protein [Chelatococcus reniformis]GGC64397.1 hypothetical protein GCM10010994_23750 [Chelatococcus reniformis]
MRVAVFGLAALVALGAARAEAPLNSGGAAPAAVSVAPVFRSDRTAADQPIRLPGGDVEVVVSRYTIPPGAKLPVHKHPHPRYAYVEAGTLRVSSADGARSTLYRPGDFIVEMVDTWHFGAAEGAEAVKLLVIDQIPPGAGATVLRSTDKAQ